MNLEFLKEVLKNVQDGKTDIDEATKRLSHLSFENIEYANVDHHRKLRKGFPEVIYGQGKTAEQIIGIMDRIISAEDPVLVTRIDAEKAAHVLDIYPESRYDKEARILTYTKKSIPINGRGTILVVSAGTSDIPVAKEAKLTAEIMGNNVKSVFDVGVAGIHRLFAHEDLLNNATVIVCVAGMEGALPSVVAGMVGVPVIAVPTSVGYGISMGGMTALFAMLNSCSSNVAVVNIDNGFGAGYMAAIINRRS